MPKKLKIFLDSSALISGLNSSNGGSGIIISAFLANKISAIISVQVIDEVQKNINEKFPLLQGSFLGFLVSQPIIASQPTLKEITRAYEIIKTNDAPILAAAVKAKPDFLITLDTKHFFKKEVMESVPFTICSPKDFLQKHWNL
ncbi:MAG: putative toxin-antitoxin system toxin component, PIN family [Candidatus Pacebacteria bacterium]|nr:putative toxin-antitoxin system toxin component, PIN family [Candidatus Paceibacterota bacterium]